MLVAPQNRNSSAQHRNRHRHRQHLREMAEEIIASAQQFPLTLTHSDMSIISAATSADVSRQETSGSHTDVSWEAEGSMSANAASVCGEEEMGWSMQPFVPEEGGGQEADNDKEPPKAEVKQSKMMSFCFPCGKVV